MATQLSDYQDRVNRARQLLIESTGTAIQKLNELNNLLPDGYPSIVEDITLIADVSRKVTSVVPLYCGD